MGHVVKVGFNFLQGLFIGDDSRAESCNAAGKLVEMSLMHILKLFAHF